jgi:hypothetical protein
VFVVQVATTKVSSIQWLGPTLRFAAISTTTTTGSKAAGRSKTSRTVVTIVDLVTSAKSTLLDNTWKSDPTVVLRSCPHGRYLLVVPSEGATQVWNVPIGAAPMRVRMLPLQFTALAWVDPPYQVRSSRIDIAPQSNTHACMRTGLCSPGCLSTCEQSDTLV